MHKILLSAICSLLLSLWTVPGNAQDALRISDLTPIDRRFMTEQREYLTDLAERQYGRGFNGNKDNDLQLLQRLLDDGLVSGEQTQALQGMGVIMGDLLAVEFDLHWVIYEDRLGRSRALRYQQTDNYLFPITMISRRREVDNRTPVTEIYTKAASTISAAIPALPFQ